MSEEHQSKTGKGAESFGAMICIFAALSLFSGHLLPALIFGALGMVVFIAGRLG